MTPGGPDEADLIAALRVQGDRALPARLSSVDASPLEIAGEHLTLRLPLAQLTQAEMVFDAVRPRLGELTFTGTRAFLATGERAPLTTLTEGEPL